MIKTEIGEILGVKIEGWLETFTDLDTQGKIDQRSIHKILAFILSRLEIWETGQVSVKPVEEAKPEKTAVYNPEKEDFHIEVRRESDNKQIPYVLPALDIAYFEPGIAKIIAKEFAAYLAGKGDLKKGSDIRLKEAEEKINVK